MPCPHSFTETLFINIEPDHKTYAIRLCHHYFPSLLTKEGEKRRREEKGREKEYMKEWDTQEGERMVSEGKKGKRYLDQGTIKGLARNLALVKFPGIHKDSTPGKTLSNIGEDT